MHKVYTPSYLNISAFDAKNGTRSLFRNCNTSLLECTTIRASRNDTNGILSTKLYFVGSIVIGLNIRQNILSTSGVEFSRKNFCRQESFTSAASNSLGNVECTMYVKKYPDARPRVFIQEGQFKRIFNFTQYIANSTLQSLNHIDLEACYESWNMLVDEHTTTLLTRSSARLVAMSGIAKFVPSIFNDEYVAGLWRQNLTSQLLW
jgi:hypothetical protein